MITSGQRAQLRKMANTMKATEKVGKSGITENLIRQLDETLEIKEMFKINVLETAFMSTKECAGQLADALGADVVQCIGSKIVLYRPAGDPEKRKIVLE